MATAEGTEMLTVAKVAAALGISQGKVRKLIEQLAIEPDEVKRGCKYYGSATLEKLKAEVQEA